VPQGVPRKIAVLYGAYHIKDLSLRFSRDLGLRKDDSNEPKVKKTKRIVKPKKEPIELIIEDENYEEIIS
jgi:hypothetical protein